MKTGHYILILLMMQGLNSCKKNEPAPGNDNVNPPVSTIDTFTFLDKKTYSDLGMEFLARLYSGVHFGKDMRFNIEDIAITDSGVHIAGILRNSDQLHKFNVFSKPGSTVYNTYQGCLNDIYMTNKDTRFKYSLRYDKDAKFYMNYSSSSLTGTGWDMFICHENGLYNSSKPFYSGRTRPVLIQKNGQSFFIRVKEDPVIGSPQPFELYEMDMNGNTTFLDTICNIGSSYSSNLAFDAIMNSSNTIFLARTDNVQDKEDGYIRLTAYNNGIRKEYSISQSKVIFRDIYGNTAPFKIRLIDNGNSPYILLMRENINSVNFANTLEVFKLENDQLIKVNTSTLNFDIKEVPPSSLQYFAYNNELMTFCVLGKVPNSESSKIVKLTTSSGFTGFKNFNLDISAYIEGVFVIGGQLYAAIQYRHVADNNSIYSHLDIVKIK